MICRLPSIRLCAAGVSLGAILACHASPVTPSPPAGRDPFAGVQSARRVTFPSGPALLRIWGHSLLTDGPFCGPVLGTPEGSSVGAVVMVTAEGEGWTVRLASSQEEDGLQLHIALAGRTVAQGEVLVGSARGSMRDTFVVAPTVPRDLRVNLSSEGPGVLEGLGTTAQPYFQGTIAGHIRYTDSHGGLITCATVYWSLWPFTPLPGP